MRLHCIEEIPRISSSTSTLDTMDAKPMRQVFRGGSLCLSKARDPLSTFPPRPKTTEAQCNANAMPVATPIDEAIEGYCARYTGTGTLLGTVGYQVPRVPEENLHLGVGQVAEQRGREEERKGEKDGEERGSR